MPLIHIVMFKLNPSLSDEEVKKVRYVVVSRVAGWLAVCPFYVAIYLSAFLFLDRDVVVHIPRSSLSSQPNCLSS